MSIKCSLGFHKWIYEKSNRYADYPNYVEDRCCERCGKKQHYLPGYGGSEIGSWNP